MLINKILSDRLYQKWPSWHIVYEWEDELSDSLNLPIVNSPVGKNYFYRNFKRIDNRFFNGRLESIFINSWDKDSDYSLYFEMCAKNYKSFSNSRKTIPVIIDFWDKNNLLNFKRLYEECPFLLISNLEVFEFLKENNISDRLVHFPMTLPSKYKINPNQIIEKEFDIILAGRVNAVLLKYLKEYENKYPEIEYLQQVQKNGELYYASNKRGILGKFQSRTEYINLIKLAKVGFYSTPGIDGGEERTNGFNPVTPRFFELLAAGCQILARYPKTIETDFYRMDKICPSITNYEEFEAQLSSALNSSAPLMKYYEYLNNCYTASNTRILGDLE